MLEAGKHVLCEKPMAMSVAEAERMVEAQRRTGRKLMIAHMWRFDREIQWLRELVSRGDLGRVFKAKSHAIWLHEGPPIDGVCLVLHGAMLVESIWSGETDLVRSVRALVGQDVLIAAMLDMHGTLTEEFANKVDTWAGYRTAPHRDIDETLQRALSLLVQSLRSGKRPKPAFVRVPLLLQGEKATTDAQPMKGLLAMAHQIEELPGILNAEVLVGNGWADSPHAGANVAGYGG